MNSRSEAECSNPGCTNSLAPHTAQDNRLRLIRKNRFIGQSFIRINYDYGKVIQSALLSYKNIEPNIQNSVSFPGEIKKGHEP